jgi:CTP synthase (UTP-ammonia lyase)
MAMKLTGQTPDKTYVEICEIDDHPWYLGCQFHPESNRSRWSRIRFRGPSSAQRTPTVRSG